MARTPMSLICAVCVAFASTMAQANPSPPSAQEQRDQLNRAQAEAAQHQLDENAANRRAYDAAVQA